MKKFLNFTTVEGNIVFINFDDLIKVHITTELGVVRVTLRTEQSLNKMTTCYNVSKVQINDITGQCEKAEK